MRTYSPGLNPPPPRTHPYAFIMTTPPPPCGSTLWMTPTRKMKNKYKNVKITKMLKIAAHIKLKRRNNVLPNNKNSIYGRKQTN